MFARAANSEWAGGIEEEDRMSGSGTMRRRRPLVKASTFAKDSTELRGTQ